MEKTQENILDTNISLNRSSFITEADNHKSNNIDKVSTKELVDIFVEEDKKPQESLEAVKNQLVKAIDQISARIRNGGRLFYIGAGTSGRLAVIDAAECPPTFCTSPDLVQAIIAGGKSSLLTSSEGIEDSTEASIDDLKNRKFSSKDCLIGITAGGTTPYVLSALDYSKKLSALTVAITSVTENQSPFNVDIAIRLLTGPELISGSTRLKAGTATKMTLNIISTGVMIKLGKVYGNKMIDLSVKNTKLLDRSIRILSNLLKIDRYESQSLIKRANGSVKIACLMKLSGIDFNKASNILINNDNQLTRALAELEVEMPHN